MESKEKIVKKGSKNTEKKGKRKSPKKEKEPSKDLTNSKPIFILDKKEEKANDDDNNKDKIKKREKRKKNTTKKNEKEKKIMSLPPLSIIPPFDPFSRTYENLPVSNESNDRLSLSIRKLKTDNESDILNELISLCEFLALSNSRIGLNPKMPVLLEEICKFLTKTNFPEIVSYSLQCINHILDIKPRLANNLNQIKAIPSIMNVISCIQDSNCLEYVIKVLEKISNENSRILLENNVFVILITNVYDFMNIYLQKTIIKICYKITEKGIYPNEYNSYIKPAIQNIINIFKVDEGDNNDNLFIAENIGKILFNIVNCVRYEYNYLYTWDIKIKNERQKEMDKERDIIVNQLIDEYNIIEKYMEILNKYFVNNAKNITEELIKTILKTIIKLLEKSKNGMAKLLLNNFLVVISDIFNNDFHIGKRTNKKNENENNNNIINENEENINSNKGLNIDIYNGRGMRFLNEFFKILISLFPSANNNDKKILRDENKTYYDYFCRNIFLPLIKKIINKSINPILIDLLKLIMTFIKNADVKDIKLYLPSKEISQIIIKILDSKNNSCIMDSIELIKSLLEKTPEDFIVNFIREGLVNYLQKYESEIKPKNFNINDNTDRNDSELNINMETNRNERNRENRISDDLFKDSISEKEKHRKKEDFNKEKDNKEKIEEKENKDIKGIFEEEEEFFEDEEEEFDEFSSFYKIEKDKDKDKEKENNDNGDEGMIDFFGGTKRWTVEDKDKEKEKERNDNEDENMIDFFGGKKEFIFGNKDKDKEKIKIREEILNYLKRRDKFLGEKRRRGFNYLDNNLFRYGRRNSYDYERNKIHTKIKDLLDNYLTEEKISLYLSKTESKTKENLIKIQTTLSNYQKLLSASNEENNTINKKQYLKEIIDILTDENIDITLFELENSKILLSLCNYFDKQFNKRYDKLIDDSEYKSLDKLVKDLDNINLEIEKVENYEEIIKNIFNFFEIFSTGDNNNDIIKIINFMKLLRESIQNINSPIYSLNDRGYEIYNSDFSLRGDYELSIKMNYDEEIFRKEVLNSNIIIDESFKSKLCEINTFYLSKKIISLKILDNYTFRNISSLILAFPNIPIIFNDKYDIIFKFFVNNNHQKLYRNNFYLDDMEIEDEFNLNPNIFFDEEIQAEKNINNTFDIDINWTYRQLLDKYKQKRINPVINFSLTIKIKEQQVNKQKIKADSFLDNYELFIKDINYKNVIDFVKYNFMKDYYNFLVVNKSLYFSKRLMPSLYLGILIYLSLFKYKDYLKLSRFFPKDESKKNNNQYNIYDLSKLFLNSKIEQFISKLSVDMNKVKSTSFSILRKYITENNFWFSKFRTRFISLKTSFSPKFKSLIFLQNYIKQNASNSNNIPKYSTTLTNTMRLKINVDRDKIIESGLNILNYENTFLFQGFLEFEYKGEIGNGVGPTLEFYTLIIDKIREDKNMWYKTTNGYLFPKLLNPNENNDEILEKFKLLGFIIGRAIYDDRLLDIPLSNEFWGLLLNYPVDLNNIKFLDKDLYKTLFDFLNVIKKNKEYIIKNNIENIKNTNFDNIILYNNCKLSDLDIYFIFPGYNNIELKPNGNDILLTMNNIEEYVNLIFDYFFYKGVNLAVKSFKEGFNINFNIEELKCFTLWEIVEYICCGGDKKWEEKNLYENIKPDHGYSIRSKTFVDLIKFMCNLDKNNRRKFLIFTTGCSRLPLGGFKALSLELTVVKKNLEEENDPENYLPTVMTCQNYLKIPEYSSYNILENKLLLAMNEGCNEFNLS